MCDEAAPCPTHAGEPHCDRPRPDRCDRRKRSGGGRGRATLVAHFLTETSGTVAVDASGSGRDGTYVGAPALTGGEECDSTAPTIT
nr:hypothetical protein GCM10025699_38400 [Microbacterium flavescens]